MADIKIIIDTTDLVDAKKKLASFQKQMGNSQSILGLTRGLKSVESNVKELVAAQKKGQLSSKSFKQGLLEQKRALVELGVSSQKASGSVQALASAFKKQAAAKEAADATRDLARAQKEVADSHERTRQKYVAGVAAQTQLKQAQRELSAAYRAGVVNIDEYRQALIRLNQQNVGNRRSTNNLGVAMQQTGYQVGDFVVQVQSGQNPMVAFGQQATQLVGVMYLLPPATLAATKSIFGLRLSVSALIMTLGIAIPILTAIGAAYMRFKENSDVAGKAANKLKDDIDSLKQSLKDYKREKVAEGLGITVDQLISKQAVESAKERLAEVKQEYLDKMSSSNPVTVFKFLLDAFNPATTGLDTTAEQDAVIEATQLVLDIEKRLAEQQAKRYEDRKFQLEQENLLLSAISVHGSDSARVKSLEIEQEIELRHRELEAQRKSLELKGEDVGLLKKQVEANLRLKKVIDDQESADEVLDKRKEAQKSFQEQLVAQANLIALMDIEADKGKDHADYRAELVLQEETRLQKLLEQKLITEDQLRLGLILYQAELDSQKTLDDNANSANNLADALKEAASAMNSLQGFSDSLDKKLAVSVAKVQALKNGVDSAISGSIAGMRMDLDKKMSDSISSGVDLGIVERMFGGERERISQYETSENERKRLEEENRGSSSSKASTKDPIADFQKKLDLERELLGVSEARQKVLQALGSDVVAKNPEIVAGMEHQIAVTNEIIALEKERQGVIDTITGSMETGLMAMIDGTVSVKDAFKQMAADIIKELMRVYVVQQMVSAVKMFFGLPFADGGAFSGGSQIQAYADGGVVGSPTTFPMAGGKTGLMGEAGPEAIMPLKRGANGKLGVQMEGGGGDTINVVQNFSFQANGDDSVKKIIAQAAPQIAQMTKSSLLNDRRRGGATKAAFG